MGENFHSHAQTREIHENLGLYDITIQWGLGTLLHTEESSTCMHNLHILGKGGKISIFKENSKIILLRCACMHGGGGGMRILSHENLK